MKTKLLVLILFIFIGLTPFAGNQNEIRIEQSETKNLTVYICTGEYSKKYHSYSSCRGLNNCQASIIAISQEDAVNKYSRTACLICWE